MKAHHNLTGNPDGSSEYDRQQTVLLVDNVDANLKFMSEVLRMSGYGVAVFHDAPSALFFSIRNVRRFDLVITDHRLPGIDGLELVDALKRLHPDVPMVLLTDPRDIDICFKASNPGIFEFITKPINKLELLRIVQEALGNGMPEQVPAVLEGLMAHAEQYQNKTD